MKHAKPTNFPFILNPAEFIIRRRRSVIRTSAAFLSDSSRIFSFDWRNAARDRRLFDRPVRTLDRNIIHLLSSPFNRPVITNVSVKSPSPAAHVARPSSAPKTKAKKPNLGIEVPTENGERVFFLKNSKIKSSKSVVYGGKVGRLFSHATG